MSLSKDNLKKLKSIIKKESYEDKSLHQKPDQSKTNQPTSSNKIDPEQLFYSIIDNSSTLHETTVISSKLKESEENLFKSKIDNYNSNNFSKPADFNKELSEEELLYDEFNYLLDE